MIDARADTRLRELRAESRSLRKQWEAEPSEATGRKILAVEDATYARYLELVRTDLDRARAVAAEARVAVQEARDGVREARRGLTAGEGPVDAVLAAEDRLRDARRRLRHACTDEEIARAHLTEAALARWGPDTIEAVVGMPIRVSVSPSSGGGIRDALFGDVT